jgi:retron-type reverse transcriptase
MEKKIDTSKEIREMFLSMRTQEDLLCLLNLVKKILEENSSKEFYPIEMHTLNYYKNIKASGRSRYKTFEIPKKSGKTRIINAPYSGLKIIQSCVNYVLEMLYEPNAAACGFVLGRSVTDGAKKHIGKNYVLNIDLKDFFDSIELHRVKAIFTLPPFNFSDDAKDGSSLPYILANLCCTQKDVTRYDKEGNPYICTRMVTPQGAPTSPIITNLICRQLDRRLLGLAKRFKLSYSRYADDITFSTNNEKVFKDGSAFRIELKRIIEDNQGFRINEEKTRVQSKSYRQEVTGLVVNKKVNVPQRYVKQIRMWLYLWEHYGYEYASNCFAKDYNADKGSTKHGKCIENVIYGKLNYMKMVVGEDNPSYKKLMERFEKLLGIYKSEVNVSYILDVWEKEGIDVAMKKYIMAIDNK